MRSFGTFGAVLVCVGSVGCGQDTGAEVVEGPLSQSRPALTDTQARVLGFEAPVSDWGSSQATLGTSSTVSEGALALAVTPNGWSEINSVPLASLSPVGAELTLDLRLPQMVGWGDARVVLQSPSLGLSWAELPAVSLSTLSAGAFHTLRFPLSDGLRASLAGSYTDLTIKLILNAPTLSSPYVFDRLSITDAAPSPGEAGRYGSLVQTLPTWAWPRQNAAVALNELRVNDNVRVQNLAFEPANVANLGSHGTRLGVESEVRDVTSVASVVLSDRAQVFGNAATEGFIDLLPGAVVHGTQAAPTELETGSIEFQLDLGPRGPNVEASATSALAPGRYGRVAVQGDAITLTLSSGVYALNDLYVAHQTELLIDGTLGPVVVLVSDSAAIHGRVRDVGGGFPRWILAYSGTGEVPVNTRLDGAYFTPNAKLSVATSGFGHEGVVIAKDVELHQDSRFLHNYYAPAWTKLCEVVAGRGAFCPRITSVGATGDCAFGKQPWAVGRNGRSDGFPFQFEAELEDACRFAGGDLTAFIGVSEDSAMRSPRAMTGLDSTYTHYFGNQWASEARADEVAFGDLDGDGKDELVIGRGPAGNARLIIHDDADNGFAVLQELFHGWDTSSGVRSLAIADFDADGEDEIAVGRNAPSGADEVFVLDSVRHCAEGTSVTFEEVARYGAGDRMVRGLAFGDVDNDGFTELVIARDGLDGSGADRLVVKEIAEDGAVSGFAHWGDSDRDATALAIGDFEGDGLLEIAVGRGSGGGARVIIYRFNPELGDYELVRNLHDGWDDGRHTTALAFGDLDGDGDDELVVGRDGCSECSGPDPRVIVHEFQGTPDEYPVLREIGEIEDWGKGRSATSLAIGDVNGDGLNDIMVGRDEGGGARVLFYNGPGKAFEEIMAVGNGWGDNRRAQSVAIAPRPVCHARDVSEPSEGGASVIPPSVEESKDQFPDRLAEVVEAVTATFLPSLQCAGPHNPDLPERLLGEWGEDDANQAAHRMLAGLSAIQLGAGSSDGVNPRLADEAQALLDNDFPTLVDQYIVNHVRQFKPVGTPYDFDFNEMSLLSILYRFRNTPHPLNPSTFLLSDEAVQTILHVDCDGPFEVCPDRTVAHGLQAKLDMVFKLSDYCVLAPDELAKTIETEYFIPESENHVLMINTWHYLVHQWNQSSAPRTLGGAITDSLPVAPVTALENKLMEIVARVVKNDMWETNARAYAAFSVRPLQLLASYAGSARLRTGARNALDFLATKFAFQSLHGKRLPPMRRNYKYKERLGLYDNDYLPALFGVLTGDRLFDTTPSCSSNCQYQQSQPRAFALESALTQYRVPDVVIDHMLNADGGQAGFGTWARMQARYTNDHYRLFHDPAYHELGKPGESVEPAQEFYFRTRDYLNSAGGRHEHYDLPFESAVDLLLEPLGIDKVDLLRHGTDFLARPTVLIGNHDNGYWKKSSEAANETLWLPGNEAVWGSNNTGVYKNFALGYWTDKGLQIPGHLQADGGNPSATIGDATFVVVDAANTDKIFAGSNYHLVLGTLPGNLGFWEVVPRGERFESAEEVLDRLVATNGAGMSDTPMQYTMLVSGEVLTLNADYPNGAPFLAVDGSSPALTHLGPAADFPLIDVRQVNAGYQFTGVHYACANGDGRLVVQSENLDRQLVIDSTDSQNPTRNENGTLVNPCPAILAGI